MARDLFPDFQQAQPLIYFIHIEKTGGSALRAYFRSAFGAERCLFHDSRKARPGQADLLAIAETEPQRLADYRVVGGHIGFGRIPPAILALSPVLVSELRDPVARIISNYQHIRTKTAHPMHDRLKDKTLYQAMHAQKFVTMVDRWQIMSLCGRRGWPALQTDMEKRKFIIGKQEKSQELVNEIASVFGTKAVAQVETNKGSPGYLDEIRAQTGYRNAVDLIKVINRAEYRLYNSFDAVFSNL